MFSRRGGNLGLGGCFRSFPFLFFLQHLKIVAFGIGAAGTAVTAELGIVTVQGVAEGTVPVRIFTDIFCLFLIQVFHVSPFIFLTGFAFIISLHIKLYVSAGTAAGRTVDNIPADFFRSAEGTVPVTHDELRHVTRSFDQTAYALKSCIHSLPLYIGNRFSVNDSFPGGL